MSEIELEEKYFSLRPNVYYSEKYTLEISPVQYPNILTGGSLLLKRFSEMEVDRQVDWDVGSFWSYGQMSQGPPTLGLRLCQVASPCHSDHMHEACRATQQKLVSLLHGAVHLALYDHGAVHLAMFKG